MAGMRANRTRFSFRCAGVCGDDSRVEEEGSSKEASSQRTMSDGKVALGGGLVV
jgi:hypothetical protein